MKISIRNFGSSSSGNATLINNDNTALLIDCGFSTRYLRGCLSLEGMDFKSISGILITHTHADHLSASMVKTIMRERLTVYAPDSVARSISAQYPDFRTPEYSYLLQPISTDWLAIDGFTVSTFKVPHDADGGCFGYTVSDDQGKKITVATDIGYTSPALAEAFADSDILVLESNHDLSMLLNSNRPRYLIDRIRSIGHLSNDECADFLLQTLGLSKRYPEAVFLAHVSQQCNTNRIAHSTMRQALERQSFGGLHLVETHRRKISETVIV